MAVLSLLTTYGERRSTVFLMQMLYSSTSLSPSLFRNDLSQ
ncbi:hypothetical protein [Pectobacterium wasabiae]|nr:hypothetical protein [Pectobacterium wasabiae]